MKSSIEEGNFGGGVKKTTINLFFHIWIPQLILILNYSPISFFFSLEAGRRCYVGIAMELALLVVS